MIARAILLVALFVFTFGEVHADNVPILPSNKASFVMPLLERLTKDKPKRSIQQGINRILGKGERRGVAGGTPNFSWVDLYWDLDDKTEIYEALAGPSFSLTAHRPDGSVVTLYPSQSN